MSRSPIEIEELLTGLIDGQLSDAERVEIEERVSSDQQLRTTLNALQRNRELLSSMSVTTSPRFDSRIVAMAKQRCRENSVPAPDWLQEPKVQRVTAERTWWKRNGVSLAIAAALAFVLASGIVLSILRNDGGKNEVVTVPNPGPEPELQPKLEDPSTSIPPALANNTNTPETKKPNDLTPAPVAPDEHSNTPLANSIASTDAPKTPVPEIQNLVAPNVAPTDPNVENSLANAVPNQGMELGMIDIVMVVDVTVGKDVDSMEIFNQLLSSFGIAMAEDLNVDVSVVETLEKARLLQGQLAEERRQNPADSTSLLFVKSRANRIDAMVETMISDVEAFPEISLDALMDTPDIPLLGELRSVQEAELSQSQKQSVATSVASPLRSAQNGKNFASALRRQPAMPLDARRGEKPKGSSMLSGDGGNPISYVLFVIRSSQ